MAINPVNNSAAAAAFLPVKKAAENVNNGNQKINHPAVAPGNAAVNNGNNENKAIKKAAPVQPQESKSTVKRAIDKLV